MNLARHRQALGLLLIVELVLSAVPAIILGAAIEWPGSLGLPGEQILLLIQEHLPEVRLGYGAYLVYSVLFFPILVFLTRLAQPERTGSALVTLAVGLAALSTLARSVGILRWLAVVPPLAVAYTDPAASVETQRVAAALFQAVDAYCGAIGEAFGIGLFGGGAILVFSLTLLIHSTWPHWLGWVGIAVGSVQMATFVPVFGLDLPAVTTAAAISLMAWFLVLTIELLRPHGQGVRETIRLKASGDKPR